ncbi:HAD family hydrolase [Thermus scotoductus]|jgi:putative nucleotidyltransferase with HDIG domain|uniref:HAD family hydrolase n=1 Tax=Thermus scotoductus TaxID=37636 RepID=A0A430UVS3_THESC|nr:HD domain-containing protein [Thermus scotoductus]RTG95670.1 HAD family hydrolase [Thermus scotoductus]RTH02228.1 HAD family hydrolase [Thermus scotoductus]RTH17347.1 HAD family hydrolase [Thermus scotoductus]RTH24228.1 HAD family hydrolase [Thermus scotoductus]RTH26202.1 HAD family hydrolase [Thermus scotoductus]
MPSFAEALALMEAWTESESLRRHMRAVEVAMRAYARRYGEDEELWAMAGVLHDMDYEKYPQEHPYRGVEELRRLGYPEEVLEAILGHASYTGVPRRTLMAKALFAVDELTGLITAAVYVRPDRSILGLELSSLKKKFKDKAFAKGVNREEIRMGAEDLGLSLDEHMALVLEAMRKEAELLGLK